MLRPKAKSFSFAVNIVLSLLLPPLPASSKVPDITIPQGNDRPCLLDVKS